MAIPAITALKMWVGTLFTKDDWDFNFSQIVSWLSDGNSDLVVNTIKATNGIDLDGAQIMNLGTATTGSQAVTLDQATTLLNRTSYYYPFSVASGKVDSNGDAAYLQKDSDTQVTVLGGNVNPDLVCISSDGTVESVTSNTVLTVPSTNGTYYIIKEKEQAITITTGSANKITIGKTFPPSQNTGDYFLDNSIVPFKGYKYGVSGWVETPFCYLGYVTVSSGVATVTTFAYNDNRFDVNRQSISMVMPDYTAGTSIAGSLPYTCPKNGVVYCRGNSILDGYNWYPSVIVDGQSFSLGFASGGYQDQDSVFIPVAKGSVINTSGSQIVSINFYPAKGDE
jgi:hypothetical protein